MYKYLFDVLMYKNDNLNILTQLVNQYKQFVLLLTSKIQ